MTSPLHIAAPSSSSGASVEQLRQASLECNNHGVALLSYFHHEQQCPDEAIEAFTIAAQMMHPVTARTSQRPGSSTVANWYPFQSEEVERIRIRIRNLRHETIGDYCCDSGTCSSSLPSATTTPLSSTSSSPCLSDPFVYNEPIPLDTNQPLEDNAQCVMESAVIICNMAMAHLTVGSTISKRRALVLFNLSLNLANSLGPYTPNSSASPSQMRTMDSSRAVILASLNNAAVIHHSFGAFGACQQYTDLITAYVSHLPTPKDKSDVHVRQRFLLNAVFLRPNETAGAA